MNSNDLLDVVMLENDRLTPFFQFVVRIFFNYNPNQASTNTIEWMRMYDTFRYRYFVHNMGYACLIIGAVALL